MELKQQLEMLAFASRRDIAAEVPGGDLYLEKGTETITAEEFAMFLKLAAAGHRSYYQYSRISRLSGMLKSKCLYLSRLSEMNDLDEFLCTKEADRIYVASFSFGEVENMGLWRMYGGDAEESIRLEFDGKTVRGCLCKRRKVYQVVEKDGNPTSEHGPEIDAKEIADWSFHDVAYKYGSALTWNGKIVGEGRCSELEDPFKIPSLVGFVKRKGWSYENETRILIKLASVHPEWKRIAVDFSDAISGMSVLIGPASSKRKRVLRAFADSGVNVDAGHVKNSNYFADL